MAVCFLDGPAVGSREERADEALRVFPRMLADHFDGDVLRSRTEAAAASASDPCLTRRQAAERRSGQ